MTFIGQNEINEIRSNASIVDIISSYIPLTQKGKNYFGVCPFHEDHSPSMSVSPEKQIYKCFSCGATGNVFTFVENYLNMTFSEAVELVANRIGMPIQVHTSNRKEKYKDEYDLMDFVMHFYQNNLNTEAGNDAISYLKERGILEDTIKDFEIGLSLDKSILYDLLSKKGYSEKLQSDLGIVNINSGKAYDVFQNRIMFPIHNLEGKVVGFTARNYKVNVGPKYLNSKETYLFKKGNILFNYHRAREAIRLLKQVVIVEGNMDAIRLYSVGIKNVIALMGTSLTKDQVETIKKLRAQVILMLDNDDAGETATYQNGNILEENKVSFSVVRLSGAKDPDEYVLKYGKNAMEENIKNAISFVDFKLNYLKKDKNLKDTNDLATYVSAVIESLKNNPDEILKEVTLQKLANDYNISYAVLREQMGQAIPIKEERKKEKKEVPKEKKSGYAKTAEEILFYMMHSKEFIQLYQTRLGVFPTKEHRMIANEILYYYETNKTMNLADFITYVETNPLKEQIMDIINNEKEINLTEDGMLELLSRIKKNMKEQEIKKLKEELKNETDINKKMNLIEKITEIKKGSVENEDY